MALSDFFSNFHLFVRWLHVIAGITWIGMLYFFNFVNLQLQGSLDDATKNFFRPQLEEVGIPISQLARPAEPVAALRAAAAEIPALLKFIDATAKGVPFELHEIWLYIHTILAQRPGVFHGWMDDVNVKGGVAAAILGVPRIVLSTRSAAPDNFQVYQPFMREAYRALLKVPSVRIINNSAAGARDYERWLGIPEGTIGVVRNGFDFARLGVDDRMREAERYRDQLRIPSHARVVGTIIRFSEEKRPILWIEAAIRIARELDDVCFLMMGDGPLRPEAAERMQRAGFADRIFMPGYEKNTQAGLAAMDVFLLTSRMEGLPNVLIEAQAAGTPVVAPDVGGVRETFDHGETGWLLQGSDPDLIANTLVRILNDRNALEGAKIKAQAMVRQRFDLSRMVRETLSVYFPTY